MVGIKFGGWHNYNYYFTGLIAGITAVVIIVIVIIVIIPIVILVIKFKVSLL